MSSAALAKVEALMTSWRVDSLCPTYTDLLDLQRLLQQPVPMVLYCPACGLQHIDADNSDEVRIAAAELGLVGRDLEEYVEKHEWLNEPHTSHLCAGCEFQWRPADVETTGVAAIITRHTNDSPARYNLHDDLAVIHSIAASQLPHSANIREAFTRIRELSNRTKNSKPANTLVNAGVLHDFPVGPFPNLMKD